MKKIIVAALALLATQVMSDEITAEVQTRLRLLNENPGTIDGAFGNKTNAAINRILGTKSVNYRSDLETVNQLLIELQKSKRQKFEKPIYHLTNDYIEHEYTDTFVLWDSNLMNRSRDHYESHVELGKAPNGFPIWPGTPSKFYSPDVNKDGVSDLVIFGVGPDFASACTWSDYCEGDGWMRAPDIYVQRPKERGVFDRAETDEYLYPGVVNSGTGGKVVMVDFNNDGVLDFYLASEGPTRGPNSHTGERDTLMISQPDGKFKDISSDYPLLGGGSFQHWAAAGDIDNDGDIDFIFHHLRAPRTNLGGDRIDCFINDGNANFTVKKCVDTNKGPDGVNSVWGATLFDLNGDNYLDIMFDSQNYKGLGNSRRNWPVVYLGDGSGRFKNSNKINIYLPEDFPKNKLQFGYQMAADLEDDGLNEIFFSVQGAPHILGEKCKSYCGSYVGYFKNDNGFLRFGGWVYKTENMDMNVWGRTSQIVVKDYIGNDGLKDVYLKRNYFLEGQSPFFQQMADGTWKNHSLTIIKDENFNLNFANLSNSSETPEVASQKQNLTSVAKTADPFENLCEREIRDQAIKGRRLNSSEKFWEFRKKLRPDYPTKDELAVMCSEYLN